MKFSEYLNQENPFKLSSFSVLIDPEFWKEYIHVSKPLKYKLGGQWIETRTVSFKYHGTWFTYRTDSTDNGELWTMDEDGNKKSRSVFKLLIK